MRFVLGLLLALLLPAAAVAQSCTPPASFAAPHAVTPRDDEPVRQGIIAGYTLALTWAPEYCHGRSHDEGSFECGGVFARRFVLHGLWPDGTTANGWPEFCRPAAILPTELIRRNLCMTPSPQLLQHEWAKHGVCMADDPARYFGTAAQAFGSVRYPDMAALARVRGLTAGRFAQAFAAANPGMAVAMLRVTANKRGWLEEVRLCLGRDRRPAACPGYAEGAAASAPLRIEDGFRGAGAPPGRSPWKAGRRSSQSRDDAGRGAGG